MLLEGSRTAGLIEELAAALRRLEVPVSTEQIIDANDIALMLLSHGNGTVDSQMLLDSLAPLFSANAAELESFSIEFGRVLRSHVPEPEPAPQPRTPAPRKSERPSIVRRWRRTRLVTTAIGLPALMSAAVWLILALTPNPETGGIENATDTNAVDSGDPQPISGGVSRDTSPSETLSSLQLPLRPPSEIVVLRADRARMVSVAVWTIVAIPTIVGLLALLRLIVDRRIFLSADRTRSHPEIKPVPIAEVQAGLYQHSNLDAAITRLRLTKKSTTRRLDIRRTVQETIDDGGFPTLVYESRLKRPGYVLLIERRNAIDFFAHAAKALADYLHRAGLEVHAFAFKGRPYRLTPLWRKGHRVTYQEVLQRYHGDALILAGDPGTMRRGKVAGANAWRPDINAWSAAGLLSSNSVESWNEEEEWFFNNHFAVAPFGSEGFEELSAWLGARDETADEPSYAWELDSRSLFPRLLFEDSARWMDDKRQFAESTHQKLGQLLQQLRAYLGDDGMYLLGAISAYPELRWPIARYLNEALFTADGEQEFAERRLLRIASLPWCREGHMPGFVRLGILKSLSDDQRNTVQSVYYNLLNDAHREDEGGPAVEIAAPGSKSFREFLGNMLSTAPPGPYRDFIFQSVLLDSPQDMIGLELSRQRSRSLGRQSWRRALPALTTQARKTAIATGIAAFIAFVYLQPMATNTFEDRNRLANAGVTVRILYYTDEAGAQRDGTIESTADLAERAQWALSARGFNVVLEPIESAAEQLQAMVAQQEAPRAPAFVADSTPAQTSHSLLDPIRPNRVFYNGEAGVSLVDYAVLATRTGFVNRASTPMLEFAQVAADEIRYATYEQPVELMTSALDDSNVLDALNLSADVTNVGPDVITVLLTEKSRSFQDRLAKGGLGPVMSMLAPLGQETPDRFGAFTRPFAISKYEITFDDYDRFALITDRNLPDDGGWGRGDRPVINVSHDDAVAYAAWLSQMTGERYALPDGVVWRYAAGAGEYDSEPELTPRSANYAGGPGESMPVGSYPPNAWGIHDMQGNVAEWSADCGATDRGGSCLQSAVRNGSWQDPPAEQTLTAVRNVASESATNTIGFRVVRTVPLAPGPLDTAQEPAQAAPQDKGESYE